LQEACEPVAAEVHLGVAQAHAARHFERADNRPRDVLRVPEYHMDEVKELPDCLRLLASTKDCRVQAYVHVSKPIYGTQFHPEQAMESYPDGFQVLRNFFALARRHAATT